MKPIRGVAQALVVLLGAQVLLAVVEAIARLHRLSLLHQLGAGTYVDPTSVRVADHAVDAMTTFTALVFAATVVVWCVWQHHAQRNAAALAAATRFTPGWAVGWWFIPLANIVMPFQTVRELWKASHASEGWASVRTWPVIGWWWAAWLLSSVHVWFTPGRFSLTFGTSALGTPLTIADVISLDTWSIASLAIRVLAAMLAIAIVRSIVQLQDEAGRGPALRLPPPPGLADPLPPPPPGLTS